MATPPWLRLRASSAKLAKPSPDRLPARAGNPLHSPRRVRDGDRLRPRHSGSGRRDSLPGRRLHRSPAPLRAAADRLDHPAVATPELRIIGRVESPLTDMGSAPKQGDEGAPDAWIE